MKYLSEAYKKYFGFGPAPLDKPWTPNNACNNCRTILNKIGKGQECFFTFGKVMQWRNQINHKTDCYFCLTEKAIGRRIEAVYAVVSLIIIKSLIILDISIFSEMIFALLTPHDKHLQQNLTTATLVLLKLYKFLSS